MWRANRVTDMVQPDVSDQDLKGWNWGAFWLNWVWGIGHNTWIALLMFVPVVNLVMPFVLGAKGNRWAWENNTWRDFEHFQRRQRIWSRVGWAAAIGLPVLFVLLFGGLQYALSSSEPYRMAVEVLRDHPELEAPLGLPVEPSGLIIEGNIQVTNDTGQATLVFDIEGTRAGGSVFVRAVKLDGAWRLRTLSVHTNRGQDYLLSTRAKR